LNATPAVLGLICNSIEGRMLPGALMQQLIEPRLEHPMQRPSPLYDHRLQSGLNEKRRENLPLSDASRDPSDSAESPVSTRSTHPREWLWTFGRLLALPLRPFDRLARHLLAWRERARDRSHLTELSDHMLKDLGLSRADVEHEISSWFWRD
jgi:uncharacterized protein YjiS (DUF1127 family)